MQRLVRSSALLTGVVMFAVLTATIVVVGNPLAAGPVKAQAVPTAIGIHIPSPTPTLTPTPTPAAIRPSVITITASGPCQSCTVNDFTVVGQNFIARDLVRISEANDVNGVWNVYQQLYVTVSAAGTFALDLGSLKPALCIPYLQVGIQAEDVSNPPLGLFTRSNVVSVEPCYSSKG